MTNANNTTKNGNTTGSKRGKRRGFTLIEILIVVVILGVLAALVIPGVTGALNDANEKAAVARASQITTMLTRYKQFAGKSDSEVDLTQDNTFTQAFLNGKIGDATGAAGYCSNADLENQVSGNGWVWTAATQKLTAQ